MDLQNRTVIVFCAAGAIGSAAARALHRHGATVVLAARHPAHAADLHAELALATPVVRVDVLDEGQVAACLAEVHRRYGRVDGVFNAVGPRAVDAGYGRLADDLAADTFLGLHRLVVGGQFITARAAQALWRTHGQAGTVAFLTSSLSRLKMSGMAGLASASAAVEGLSRAFAAELGELGGRSVCINATALPETRSIRETTALQAARLGIPAEAMAEGMKSGYLLGRAPTLDELAELVAFALSDRGAILNSHVLDADRGARAVI